MKYLVLVIAIALSACATKKQTYWDKPSASASDFDQDKGQCDAQAFSVASGNLMQIALVQSSCMRGKGWKLVEK